MATNNLKIILNSEGKSQAELSRVTGVSSGTLNKVFNQKRTPALKTMSKIVLGLNRIAENQYSLWDVFPNAPRNSS